MVMVTESQFINLDSAPYQSFQLSTMVAAEKLALKKKLKLELACVRSATERIGVEFEKRSCEFNQQGSLIGESGRTTSGKEQRSTEMSKVQKSTNCHSVYVEMGVADKSKVESGVLCASKRGPPNRLEVQLVKKQRMDTGMVQQCMALLKKLMNHPVGWVFNQPVDPVALNIPDYFSIISEPMDLGTIKSKLQKKLYSCAEEFTADVRLTFSNAMLYNPPTNDVHKMAKELNRIFDMRWKSLEVKWGGESTKVGQQSISSEVKKKAQNKISSKKAPTSHVSSLPRKSMSSVDKQKLRKDLVEISKGKLPLPLLHFFQKLGLVGQAEERIEVDIDAFDDETALEVQRLIRNYLDAKSADPNRLRAAETTNTSGHESLQNEFQKGTSNSNRPLSVSAGAKPRVSPGACINGSCNSITSQCSHHNDFTQASSSDLDSERSSGRNNHAYNDGVSNLGHLENDTEKARMSKSDPDSDGAVSIVDEENGRPSSRPATPAIVAAPGERWEDSVYDGQLSPNKALRAAMLKSRFADTILKAQQKTLLNHGEKGDPIKMQQEKERLERKQREEKARIEAQIRAAEAASRMRAEAEQKMQRERAREAARIKLQQMEKTVEIDENQAILKDLEMFGGYTQPKDARGTEAPKCGNVDEFADDFGHVLGTLEGCHHGNPLERLGLFRKDDFMEEEEEEANLNGDVEEGEIGS
ncbi:PREDICTED: transcription factor GTE11 [Nelumbo nucifera]|uniref:Transcription factor GTE9-like n=2 Tax=Nelumbo nucifera TaxID=4432 RepID=A0A822Z2H4_NELNU|nr:PREDICTED: transcription factor GTE11 [Nelumbo nucifera]DAD37659.1 TPA_asm: hypothetical protein HUJ06_008300 [Nelumbo nucifera]